MPEHAGKVADDASACVTWEDVWLIAHHLQSGGQGDPLLRRRLSPCQHPGL